MSFMQEALKGISVYFSKGHDLQFGSVVALSFN